MIILPIATVASSALDAVSGAVINTVSMSLRVG